MSAPHCHYYILPSFSPLVAYPNRVEEAQAEEAQAEEVQAEGMQVPEIISPWRDLQRLMIISTRVFPLTQRNLSLSTIFLSRKNNPLSSEDDIMLTEIWNNARRLGYLGEEMNAPPVGDPVQTFSLLINSDLISEGYREIRDNMSPTTWGELFICLSTLIWGSEKNTNPLFQKLAILVNNDNFNDWWRSHRPRLQPHVRDIVIPFINKSFMGTLNVEGLTKFSDLIFHIVQNEQIEVLRELYLQNRLDEFNRREGEQHQPFSWKMEVERQKNRVKYGSTYCIVHAIATYFLKKGREPSPFPWDRLQRLEEEDSLSRFREIIDVWMRENSPGIYKHWILYKSVKLWTWLVHRIVDGILQKLLSKLYTLISNQEKWNQQVINGVEKCARWIDRGPISRQEKQGIWRAILFRVIEETIEPLFFDKEVNRAEQSMQEWVNRSHFVILRWAKWGIALAATCGLYLVEKMTRQFFYLLVFILKKGVMFFNLPDKVGNLADDWVKKAAADPSIQCAIFDGFTEIIYYRLKLMEQGVPFFSTPVPQSLLQPCSGPLRKFISGVLSRVKHSMFLNAWVNQMVYLFVETLYNQGACLEEIFLPLLKSTGDFLIGLKVLQMDMRSKLDYAKRSFKESLKQAISSTTDKKISECIDTSTLTTKEVVLELTSWISSFTKPQSASSHYPCHIDLNAFIRKIQEAGDDSEQLENIKEEMRSQLFAVFQSIQNHFMLIHEFFAGNWSSRAQIRVITPPLDCLNDLARKCCKRNTMNGEEIKSSLAKLAEIVQDMRWIEWRREVEKDVDAEKTVGHYLKKCPLSMLQRTCVNRSQDRPQTRTLVSFLKRYWGDDAVFDTVCGTIEAGLEFLSKPECVTTLLSGMEIPLSLPDSPEEDEMRAWQVCSSAPIWTGTRLSKWGSLFNWKGIDCQT